jgi:hypothetical protein
MPTTKMRMWCQGREMYACVCFCVYRVAGFPRLVYSCVACECVRDMGYGGHFDDMGQIRPGRSVGRPAVLYVWSVVLLWRLRVMCMREY